MYPPTMPPTTAPTGPPTSAPATTPVPTPTVVLLAAKAVWGTASAPTSRTAQVNLFMVIEHPDFGGDL